METFRKRGLGVAAVSYDSTAILKEFASRRKITFPLLADEGSTVIRAFGILNEADYPPGHRAAGDAYSAHGVPYPGTFVTDARGIVRSKFFEKTYVERRTAASLLALGGDAPAASADVVSNQLFTLRVSASNAAAAPGQRISLLLNFEMKPGMHAYAPGVTGYRPLLVSLDPQPLFTVHETAYPPSKSYRFAPLDETVPVFEGRFRVIQDVTLASGRDFTELMKSADPTLEITGTLQYQVCSDKLCYPPASLPLRFKVKLLPLDRERSSEATRHKLPPRP